MVFSSLPPYLDPPNWPLQHQDHPQHGGINNNSQAQLPPPPLMPPPPLPPPLGGGGAAATTTSVRPGSMAERARQAKLPHPETSLKCPRCESTNTKFCYFNNYSLTQPRHFCKTCRRYWTRGGALRNVPVGGGCRRNKRSKSTTTSKSPITGVGDCRSSSTTTTSTSTAVSSNSCSTDNINILGHHIHQFPMPAHHEAHLSFFAPADLSKLPEFGNAENITGLNFGQVGTGELSLRLFSEQWKMHPQLPFLAGLELSDSGALDLQPFGCVDGNKTRTTLMEAAADDSVKEEGSHPNQQGLNLSRNYLSPNPGIIEEQYWGTSTNGNAWTDVSGSTSSATHLM